jgi:hypothetical protein
MAPSQDKVVVKTENVIALRLVSRLYDKILNLGLLGAVLRIQIRIRVKNRIRIKVNCGIAYAHQSFKVQELERLTMEPWTAVYAHN